MITEEQKQEADRIVEKYKIYTTIPTKYFEHDDIISATNCAIQDRQSVLELLNRVADTTIVDKAIQNEIQSLTNQINYLKSKI